LRWSALKPQLGQNRDATFAVLDEVLTHVRRRNPVRRDVTLMLRV
jgi:hypothetical protein